ncbi:ABC transporter permease [Variovorax paradoxus]|uniref:ABC transporter permease subunit n=1 Tax=Variovorax TaxID=34072 RepID=UPI0006E59A64|nr:MULTISPECIES: branched-chain amino acid ABC transporter permease [unclassified Variovorax]KPU96453.1 ABC transporter permease [Variovorax paradoxus]KAF1066199.1 MAG: High-affinity branched-chain amino acid transport system permease protein LivH [Variovorax sp.]KPV09561.1 ABC transporter permease [Variovorax paradoxus]KPV12373.1 ABC transporter permease [Variovorax paradoxus]KPV23781.1 ABC transporter permease [Variovorax paradoxus]
MFAEIFSFLYQFADVFAFLILSAAGLAVVFGMMGVINMAHGEFIMCGAYVTVGLVHGGLPLPLAQLCGTLAAGLIGMAVEWSLVRKLYKRPLDSLLATFGLSLIVTQGMLLVFGSTLAGVGTPEGSFSVGGYSFSVYRLVLFAAAVAVLGGIYLVFMRTRFGVHARATMQNASIAQATGVRVGRVYALSFGIGAGLAGLCGALYAPTMTLIPTMGAAFLVESFVTVVVGGANVLLGTAPAGILLAVIRTGLNGWGGQIVGQIGMLLAVIVVIRILPEGVSGWLARRTR